MHCPIQWNTLRSELCGSAVHCMKYNFSYMHFCPQATYSLALRCSRHCTYILCSYLPQTFCPLLHNATLYYIYHTLHCITLSRILIHCTFGCSTSPVHAVQCVQCTPQCTNAQCLHNTLCTLDNGQCTMPGALQWVKIHCVRCTPQCTKVGEDEHQRV